MPELNHVLLQNEHFSLNLFYFPIGLHAYSQLKAIMKKRKKQNQVTLSSIIGAILFAVLMTGLIVFAMYYDPSKQYSNSFFDDVSEAMKWRDK